MKKWNSTLSVYSDRHLHSFLAWFIAGVLLLAVITKFLDPLDFYLVLINHTFIPAQFVRIAAAAIIGVEILIAILLVIPKLRPYGDHYEKKENRCHLDFNYIGIILLFKCNCFCHTRCCNTL